MRLAAIVGLTAGAGVALVFFVSAMNGDGEALLYSGLQPSDAAAVTRSLDQAGIDYSLREGGSAVYVDGARVDEARMRVAADGPLSFGSVGYEIFDETDALGTTEFVQNINARRALEGELARSLQTLDSVASARVQLVLPQRRLFSRETETASASVILETRGPLSPQQVSTVRNLVATAVAGLEPGNITIADGSGALLASPMDGDAAGAAALDGRRASFETDLQRKIREVVEGVVGPGAARVVVNADLERETVSQTRTSYDPEGQVLRSRTTRESTTNENDTEPAGLVSASENLPEEGQPGDEPEITSSRATEDSERTENWEITTTNETRIREAGDLRRLSVAVVVDHAAQPQLGEDGQPVLDENGQPVMTYAPRPQEEIEQIRQLVEAAMGYVYEEPLSPNDVVRQDQLTVSQMRFQRLPTLLGTPAPTGFDISRIDFMRIAEMVILFLTVAMIIFLVARPLVKGVVGGGAGAPAFAGAGAGAGAAMLPAGLPDDDGGSPEMLTADGAPERVDIARIDGAVKKSSIKKVSEIVQDHPDETMSILRNWMHEA